MMREIEKSIEFINRITATLQAANLGNAEVGPASVAMMLNMIHDETNKVYRLCADYEQSFDWMKAERRA
jgi:hypothetical protein